MLWHGDEPPPPPPPAIRWLGKLILAVTAVRAAFWVVSLGWRLAGALLAWFGRAF